MNVGITTIHNHFNYGAALQVYALCRIVERLGHTCQVIDNDIEPGVGRKFSRSRRPGGQIMNLYMAWRWQANRRFCRRFDQFSQQHIPKTERTYRSFNDLMVSPPQFDVYITGSDQVWNPRLLDRGLGDIYHLGFASPGKSRLISYAPSFGVSQIPEPYIERIRTYLLRYHALSVREKRGQEIVREIACREAEHVLDPTLLLSAGDYEPIIEAPSTAGRYMLVYPMEMGANSAFYELVKAVKRLLSIPVVLVLPLSFHYRWMLSADKIVLDAGPKEFLGFIRNASFVCTNSFHGTVFSMLFQKDFLGVPHSCTNTRIHSLLDKVGLQDRQLTDCTDETVSDRLHRPVNYEDVMNRLRYEVSHSLMYLQRALSA